MGKMSKDLPDYESPPVIEVVCGVLFKTIDKLYAPHLGLLWEKYKKEYPVCRELPPLAPVIEHFKERSHVDLQFDDIPPLPRIWYVHEKDDGIIQVQRDRFLFNWKKVRSEDEYPRYPKVIKLFKDHLYQFESFVSENDLGNLEPLQYEMTYINHIPQGEGWTELNEIGKVFPDFSLRSGEKRFLPEPERINWRTSFVLPDNSGRLHAKIQLARLIDSGLPVLLLDLTARGIGKDRSFQGMTDWFDLAREWIVRGFTDLTGEDVQRRIWRRKQ